VVGWIALFIHGVKKMFANLLLFIALVYFFVRLLNFAAVILKKLHRLAQADSNMFVTPIHYAHLVKPMALKQ